MLTEKYKIVAMLSLVPLTLRTEIKKKPRALQDCYAEMRGYIDDMIFLNTSDDAPPC